MKNKKVPLIDILESIQKIEAYTEGIDFDSFCCNDMMFDAVIRNLEIIGEAARNTDEAIKIDYSEIPWNDRSSKHTYTRVLWNR